MRWCSGRQPPGVRSSSTPTTPRSATTDDFYSPQEDLPLGGTNPAQFDRLTPTTDLVTVGIGGNDAGIAGAAAQFRAVLAQVDAG